MDGNGFFRRLVALCRKEFVQLWRDNSSLLIGTVLPILLIIIIVHIVRIGLRSGRLFDMLICIGVAAAMASGVG